MSAVEQEILERIGKLNETQKQRVLAFIQSVEESGKPSLSARELMKLPQKERDRLIQLAFDLAANEEFETFEAYSEESFDDPA